MIGMLEAVVKLFTNKFAKIEHPSCLRNGDEYCRYVITWEKSPFLIWKLLRNFLLLSIPASLVFLFILQLKYWLIIVLVCTFLMMIVSLYFGHLEKEELNKTIQAQGDTAKDLLNEMNVRYNNALLVQEIGQAVSSILDIDSLIKTVVSVIEKHLDFDRGMIMLTNESKTRLAYFAGYGYSKEKEKILRKTEFHLDDPESKGLFVLAFKEQKPFLVNDISEIEIQFSKRSQELVKQMEVQSLICVPIVYEKESLGILAVDNIKSKKPLAQSDLNLLVGVASQTAVSIINAMSFQQIKESEEKYRLHFENISDVIFSIDTEYRIISISPSVETILGYRPEELIGKHFQDLNILAPEYFEIAFSETLHALKGENIDSSVYEFIAKDGTRKFGEVKGSPLFRDGETVAMIVVARDITDKKIAEEALHREKEKFRVLVEESPLGVSLSGKDGYYKYMNPRFTKLFGYTQEDIPTGREWFRRAYPDKEYRNQVISTWISDYENSKVGKCRPRIFSVTCKDGLKKTIKFLPVTMETEDQFIIYEDITEHEKLEAQLRQAQKMEAIGRLAGGVAHDFNNLLTAIIGNADLTLMSLDKDSPLQENIEEIKKAGHRAASLTRQLLAFSRKQVLQPKVLSLNEVITGLNKMLGRMIGEDVELETFMEPDLGRIKADPGQIEQVLLNLAVNARDAMPQGGKLTIKTANVDLDEEHFRRHAEQMQPGPYVMLSVSDTGIGMNEEVLSHIFEPFFTTKETGKGTGLGMATVYGIIDQNNGYIWPYSEPEQGTTFKIYLPKIEGEVESGQKEKTRKKISHASETILMVEDNDEVRNLARNILQRYGYKVLEAENGEEALRISQQQQTIHLMLTDVVMPGMSGRELAECIQSQRSEIKVLYMSGYTDSAIVHHGVLTSGVNFIQKPFTPEKLTSKIREVLDAK
jgi:PAS domain S-box-containing protein